MLRWLDQEEVLPFMPSSVEKQVLKWSVLNLQRVCHPASNGGKTPAMTGGFLDRRGMKFGNRFPYGGEGAKTLTGFKTELNWFIKKVDMR